MLNFNKSKSVIVDVVSKYYATENSLVKVFENFSLSVAQGETLAVTGPSGSGKTTLLNLLGGLDCPDTGTIIVNGKDLANLADTELAQFRNREVGFVFQDHLLLPQCSLIENILLPVLPSTVNVAPDKIIERAKQLLQRVGLADRATHLPGELSGGEKQRTALIRALINEPSILLADEPTGALDRENSDILVELLKEVNQEFNVTIIFATHAEHLAEKMNRLVRLNS